VPTFEKLRDKLVSWYKESKYHNQLSRDESADKRSIPAMMTKAVLKRAVSAMFAPGFGQRPRQQNFVSGTEDIKHPLKCWGCGLPGHKRGDPACKADANTVHESAPGRAKRKFNGNLERSSGGGPTVKKQNGLCQFFSRNGNCKFGANCKFKHEGGGTSKPKKKGRFSRKEKKQVNALKANITKGVDPLDQDAIDELISGFLTLSVTARDNVEEETRMVHSLNVQFFDMDTFAFDIGAGEGISTSRKDFIFLNTSAKSKGSIVINGPSVGTPTCLGRGPLIFTFKVEDKFMGLIHPNGTYASSELSSPNFRLASAVQMKKLGVRYVGGKFDEDDVIECVRTGRKISTNDENGILSIKTYGSAHDLEECDELLQIVDDIRKGIRAPLVDVTPYQKVDDPSST
jgi:hypothetical protein